MNGKWFRLNPLDQRTSSSSPCDARTVTARVFACWAHPAFIRPQRNDEEDLFYICLTKGSHAYIAKQVIHNASITTLSIDSLGVLCKSIRFGFLSCLLRTPASIITKERGLDSNVIIIATTLHGLARSRRPAATALPSVAWLRQQPRRTSRAQRLCSVQAIR